MSDYTTSASVGKSPQRHIDLEDIYGELQVAGVMLDAAENFFDMMRLEAVQTSSTEMAKYGLSADIMLSEVRRIIGTAFTDLGDFIEAAHAANLEVGESA